MSGHQEKSKMKDLIIHKITDLQLHIRHHSISKVQIWGFGLIYDISLQALPWKPPPYFKEQRQSKNPYLSSYEERWVDKLKYFTVMSKLCCIADLIWLMMNESKKLVKGSVHKDNIFIVHDALVLIKAKEKLTWMIYKG